MWGRRMEYKKLGDIATYINGYPFKPEDRGECGLPIIRIQDLTGNTYDLGYYDGKYPERIEINNGDILISWSASLGVYVWNRGKALLNQHIFKVVFDKVEINKRYFVYAVQFKLKEMEAKAHGATMKHIVKKDFDSTLIPYPSLKEQSRIAETIDSIAKSINMRQKQLQKLDDLIKARFVELFASVEAEDTLQNLCTFIDYRGKTPEKVESGLPFITAKNIRMHRMSFDTLEYISKETYDRVMTRGFPQIGDVVFTTEAPLGNVCRIPFIETEFYIGQRIITMQTERLEPAYLEYALSSDEFKRKIAEKSSGSTVTGIRSKLLEQLTIPVPPRALQERFAAFVTQADKSKAAVQKALDETQLLFDSLMQKYFGYSY